MKKAAFTVLGLALVAFLLAAPTYAQATRTWVSGVGDDANPCSRTAPCKTFAGAISKTATNGEINVLDPGGFGGVTITKSITISSENFEAGVLVSGTNGVVINATTSSIVVLRGLDFEGLGTGLDGIKVIGGLGALHVEKCTINRFNGTNGNGINIAPTAVGTTKVFIKDTIVRNNGQGTLGGGILINPGASNVVKASLDNVRMENNSNFGIKVQGASSNVSVTNSVAAGNTGSGFFANTAGAVLSIESSTSTHNTIGVNCAASTSVRLGFNSITDNSGGAVSGLCSSFGNNNIDVVVALNPINPQ